MHRLARWSTIYVGVLAGYCGWPTTTSAQSDSSARLAIPSAAAQAAPSRAAAPWKVVGRSVEDRVIEYRQFGQGPRQVLVVGPLEGDETTALELVEMLADHLEQFPRRASGVTITLVRDPNPDGRLRRSAANARGVRIDQNFPTRGWRKVPAGTTWLSGRAPESEPETRALVDLIADVRPDVVIILAVSRRRAELTYCGPAEEAAREFAQLSGLRPHATNVTAEQGSLAVYTGADRNTPTLTLRVLAIMRRDPLWSAYKRALLAVLGDDDGNPANTMADSTAPANTIKQPMAGDSGGVALQPSTRFVAIQGAAPNLKDAAGSASRLEPRILSAEELRFGGNLAPVAPPPAAGLARKNDPTSGAMPAAPKSAVRRSLAPLRREFGPAIRQEIRARPTQGFAVPYPVTSDRRATRGSFPPSTLARPSASTVNALPPSMAPPRQLTSPGLKTIERLPPVGVSPAVGRGMPQAIPLYPETGH
jgi:murein peptide amidase A